MLEQNPSPYLSQLHPSPFPFISDKISCSIFSVVLDSVLMVGIKLLAVSVGKSNCCGVTGFACGVLSTLDSLFFLLQTNGCHFPPLHFPQQHLFLLLSITNPQLFQVHCIFITDLLEEVEGPKQLVIMCKWQYFHFYLEVGTSECFRVSFPVVIVAC